MRSYTALVVNLLRLKITKKVLCRAYLQLTAIHTSITLTALLLIIHRDQDQS